MRETFAFTLVESYTRSILMAVKMNMQPVKKESRNGTPFLILSDGRELAYHLTEGLLPGVVFLGGFRSDMTGAKATSMEAYCKKIGRRFLRFDYTGHGQSSGEFLDCTIGGWKNDALAMLDHIATGQNILVGSSMGGWIMLLAALERQEQVRGLLGLASAPDFTENLLWKAMTVEQQQSLLTEKLLFVPSCNGQDPYPISLTLVEEGRKNLLLNNTIPLKMPVRLVHGLNDEDVPWQTSLTLAEKLNSKNSILTFIKDAGHRLSEPLHIEAITAQLSFLLECC